jgi:hypothetical protein
LPHKIKVMRVTGETRPVGGRGFTVACGGVSFALFVGAFGFGQGSSYGEDNM